jgi:hypothetical protein
LLVERLLEPVRADPEALGQGIFPDAPGNIDHNGRGDDRGDGVRPELQEAEVALDLLGVEAVVGVGRAPLVDVTQRVDLGGDVVADKQRVAGPCRIERVVLLARDEVDILLGVQPVRRAEGHDLAVVVSLELVAATVVGETQIIDLSLLDPRERLEG